MSKADVILAAITATLLLTGAMLALQFQFVEAGAFLAGGVLGFIQSGSYQRRSLIMSEPMRLWGLFKRAYSPNGETGLTAEIWWKVQAGDVRFPYRP